MSNQREDIIQLTYDVSLRKPQEEGKPRTFDALAYTGAPVSAWFGKLVVDLDTAKLGAGIPALTGHNSEKRTGVGALKRGDDGIRFSGKLLSNDWGKAVAQDADDGFPWQMSIGFEAGRVEHVEEGSSVEVNGATFEGPGRVFREANIYEVSFVTFGRDDQTSASIFEKQPGEETNVDALQQLQKEVDDLKTANAQLKQDNEALTEQITAVKLSERKEAATALLSRLGKAEDKEQLKALLEMDENTFNGFKLAAELSAPVKAKDTSGTELPLEFFSGEQAPDGETPDGYEAACKADLDRRNKRHNGGA